MVELKGLEPLTFPMPSGRSSQLSYSPIVGILFQIIFKVNNNYVCGLSQKSFAVLSSGIVGIFFGTEGVVFSSNNSVTTLLI